MSKKKRPPNPGRPLSYVLYNEHKQLAPSLRDVFLCAFHGNSRRHFRCAK
jgi:hypothetical protein